MIVDSDIGERAGGSACRGANREAQQGIQEDQSDERSPKAPADRARRGQVNGLVQLNLAFLVPDGDYRVFEIQQIFALEFPQLKTNFFPLIGVIVINNDQRAHMFVISSVDVVLYYLL